MRKLAIVSLMRIIVATSSLTSCTAARGLPPLMSSRNIAESPATAISSSKPTGAVADVRSTQSMIVSIVMKSDEGVTDADWEELFEEELDSCMEVSKQGSLNESAIERSCRRMLSDYGPPSHNNNPKIPILLYLQGMRKREGAILTTNLESSHYESIVTKLGLQI